MYGACKLPYVSTDNSIDQFDVWGLSAIVLVQIIALMYGACQQLYISTDNSIYVSGLSAIVHKYRY